MAGPDPRASVGRSGVGSKDVHFSNKFLAAAAALGLHLENHWFAPMVFNWVCWRRTGGLRESSCEGGNFAPPSSAGQLCFCAFNMMEFHVKF